MYGHIKKINFIKIVFVSILIETNTIFIKLIFFNLLIEVWDLSASSMLHGGKMLLHIGCFG